MSGTHLLLEGDRLAPLLARARDLGGRVVHAERVRGGFWGLRRPRYEVTVEVGGLATGARPEALAVGATPRPAPVAPPAPAHSGPHAAAREGEGLEDVIFGPPPPSPTEFRITPQHALIALGVPEPLVPAHALTADGVPAGLDDVVAHLVVRIPQPHPLAQGRGDVVAVLGPAEDCLLTCAHMLRAVRTPVRLVHVGPAPCPPSALPITTRAAAAHLRGGARSGLVVALVPTVGGRLDGLSHSILRELAPTQVWAALDARRPVADLQRELETTRASVAVGWLSVQNGADCARPGALLGLGTPVGWFDGAPASRVLWTRLLRQAAAPLLPL